MSKKKHIAFVAGTKNFNLFNRRSAIDSILCSIISHLRDEFDFTVNGVPIDLHESRMKSNNLEIKPKKSIKKYIPERVKSYIRDKDLFNYNTNLISEICSYEKPDMVFELMKYGSRVGCEVSRFFNVPLIAYYDSPSAQQFNEIFGFVPWHKKYLEKCEVDTVKQASTVIVYSNPVKEYLMRMSELNDDSKFKVFQTLDYSRLSYTPRTEKSDDIITIGFIGSFMKWHRTEQLINAAKRLHSENIKIKLNLVGAGGNFQEMNKLVRQNKLERITYMPGFVDGLKLEEIKSGMDIGVMPGSNWYGIPTKVFEYGAARIASVAPATPTISDIFRNNEDIILFHPEEPEGFYKALKSLVVDSQKRLEITKNLHNRVKADFSVQKAIQFYSKILNETQ